MRTGEGDGERSTGSSGGRGHLRRSTPPGGPSTGNDFDCLLPELIELISYARLAPHTSRVRFTTLTGKSLRLHLAPVGDRTSCSRDFDSTSINRQIVHRKICTPDQFLGFRANDNLHLAQQNGSRSHRDHQGTNNYVTDTTIGARANWRTKKVVIVVTKWMNPTK